MSWNYRIIRRTHKGETGYGVHEVYYSPSGEPKLCSAEPSKPYGETLEELTSDLHTFLKALEKPVLDYDIFDSGSEGDGAEL